MGASFVGLAAGLLSIYFFVPSAAQSGGNCVILKGDSSYKWTAGGTWSGSGSVDGQSHCFASGSGRISIGKNGGVSGNTLLECFFPAPGSAITQSNFYNCDMSLVDGWSAAVTCSVGGSGWPTAPDPGSPIGCPYNLGSGVCPTANWDATNQICHNPTGGSANSAAGTSAPFQACDKLPNHAEVFWSATGAWGFNGNQFPITCTVGAGSAIPGGSSTITGTGTSSGSGTGSGTGTGTGTTSSTTSTAPKPLNIVSNQVVNQNLPNNVVQPAAGSTTSSTPAPVPTAASGGNPNPPAGQRPGQWGQWTGHWGGHKRGLSAQVHGTIANAITAGKDAHHVRAIKARSVGDLMRKK